MLIGNINAHLKGSKVVAVETSHRRLAVNFPGWGAPDYVDYLLPIPAGMTGVITDVESHGSNPYTRYGVEFADGTTAHGLMMDTDARVLKLGGDIRLA